MKDVGILISSNMPYMDSGAIKKVSINVTVNSNTVEPRKEAERITAEFKAKLMEKIEQQNK